MLNAKEQYMINQTRNKGMTIKDVALESHAISIRAKKNLKLNKSIESMRPSRKTKLELVKL